MTILTIVSTTMFSGCVARLPVPEVKEGKFDVSVTYEVDGEVKTYTGVFVCEYDGVCVTFLGAGREWSGYLEGNPDERIAVKTNEEGTIYIGLGLYVDYFMADPDGEGYDAPSPYLYMEYHSDDPNSSSSAYDLDFYGDYGVRLIDYDYADPIENNFKTKFTFGYFVPSIN